MSLDQLRRRLEKVESQRRPQQSEPWAWIVVHEGQTVKAVQAAAIAAGEMRPGQSCIAWIVTTPQPRTMHA